MNEKPLYNSRIVDIYVRLVKARYSHVDLTDLLGHAGMKSYEIADQGHWFSQEQINRFHDRLVELSGQEDIAREAGRYAASTDALGVMRQYAPGLLDPANAFALIDRASASFTRSAAFRSLRLADNQVEIVVTPLMAGIEQPFQCRNRIGFFEAVVLMFDKRLPEVRHPECIFNGGTECRYIITWETPASVSLARLRNWASLLLVTGISGVAVLGEWQTFQGPFLPTSVTALLLLSVMVEKARKKEVAATLDHTRSSLDRLAEQIDINYNNALLTSEIGTALTRCDTTDTLLGSVIQVLEKRLDYDRGLILLANPEGTRLELQAGFGYSDAEREQFGKLSFHLDRADSKGIFVLSYRERKPFLVNNLDDIETTLSPRSLALARLTGTHSFICCPIIREERSIGILAVDNMKSKRPLVQSDMSLLMGIASVIGLSIRNAELMEARQRQFDSILHAMAASIDARDSLTAGHSEKVTEYALGICSELGLPGEVREMIRVAALLHDYGKLGVPDAVLKKNGKLTEEEYRIVKTHSEKTRDILAQIKFEGIYADVPEIAGAHHEKVDGSGYPKGLKGVEIPLGAKVIAVADYFEAITAKRHYREPMAIDAAFRLLRGAVGTHFDGDVVEGLIAYYTKSYLEQSPQAGWCGENRRKPRVICRTPVLCQVNGRTVAGTSEDISVNGVFVVAGEEVTEGLPVTVTIALPDSASATVKAIGRVAWINRGSDLRKPGFPTGFGVELLGFKGATETIFRNFMSRYAPAVYALAGS